MATYILHEYLAKWSFEADLHKANFILSFVKQFSSQTKSTTDGHQ